MKNLTLKELTKIIIQQAKEKGFGIKPNEINVGEKITLIHAEISEAYAAYRYKKMRGRHCFREELGDTIQRILHLCGIFKIDIEKEILRKIEYNKTREWKWNKMNETHHLGYIKDKNKSSRKNGKV